MSKTCELDNITVKEAIADWLLTLSPQTELSYRSGMSKMIEHKWIYPLFTLKQFALINHNSIIDNIKLFQDWAENTRQARAACYISFTGFLSRRFEGVIKKGIPNKEGNAKTFFRVYEKVKTYAMTQTQWILFFKELEKINPRDSLIGKVILQGAKRANEALSLQVDQINWDLCEITFLQSKMRRLKKETVITYPESIMKKLKEYIGDRTGQVFITKSGRRVIISQLAATFAKAGKAAGIPFRVSPHVLRASAITYFKQQGFQDSDIMRVTGHSSSEMIYAYDKSSRADNASKKTNLIT